MKKLLLLCTLLGVPAVAFSQKILPTDIELRAAYCMPVITHIFKTIDKYEKENPTNDSVVNEITDKVYKKLAADSDRVHSYLQPKMPYLESTSILSAMNRGTADTMDLSKESMERKKVCQNIDWLPF